MNIYKSVLSLYVKDKYSIDNVQWNEYFIKDICEIKSGVRLTKNNQVDELVPFIGYVDNNGFTNFILNINRNLCKNVLDVNYNGSVVENFYHLYNCIFSDDVKRIFLKEKKHNNGFTLLFLEQAIYSKNKNIDIVINLTKKMSR